MVCINVDPKFFENIFEQKRRQMQERLGLINLTQANFTKMIKDIKIRMPKQNLAKVKLKRRGKKNVFKV